MMKHDERCNKIKLRIRAIRAERQRKRLALTTLISTSLCLISIISLGILMPDMVSATQTETVTASGAASLIGGHAELGYVIMGILSFTLGACLTVLIYRLRKSCEQKEKREEHSNDRKL